MDKTIPAAAPARREVPQQPSWLARIRQSDLWYSFRSHPSAIFAASLLSLIVLTAFLAPLITPQNPYDLASLELWNAEIPPIWNAEGQWPYILGTDTQGRDILSAILYGSRISLILTTSGMSAGLWSSISDPSVMVIS